MRWSKLQKLVYDIWVDDLDLQIHASAYPLSGSASVGRYWITMGKTILWDVPRDFPEERAKGTYNPVASEISEVIREYLDTPREALLSHRFDRDRWGLADVFRAADRRLGRRSLEKLMEGPLPPPARTILEARLAGQAARKDAPSAESENARVPARARETKQPKVRDSMAIQNGQAEPQEQGAAALAAAPSDVRYAHFVRAVCAAGQLWSLRDADGWLVFADADGRECVPVWPAPDVAELCATEEFAGSRPEPIPLDIFLKRWLPRMAQDRRVAAVFPTPANRGVLMPPSELLRELEAAQKR